VGKIEIAGVGKTDFPYPLGDFPLATHLDWALMGDPCEGSMPP
jgi:hypothetical protein